MNIDDAIAWLETIYGVFAVDARMEPARLDAAEARLSVRLPHALRTLYERTAGADALHRSHNRLLAPEEIDFAGEHLVFYEENQAVVVWGISRDRLSLADPSVEQGQQETRRWNFFAEFSSVSEFACAQGAWQAVQGALPYVGVVDAHASAKGPGDASITARGMRAWLVPGGVAIQAGDEYWGLATRTAEQFRAASASLGIAIDEWDFATVQEE